MGILVTQNTTIPVGALELPYSSEYDGNKAYLMAAPYGVPGPTQPISLTNYGDLSFVAPLSVYGSIELIHIDTSNFWIGSRIENHGSMHVSALGGDAYGIRANSWSPALVNFGDITVEAKNQAIAFESWGFHPNNTDPLVDNRGQITARAQGTVIGLYLANGGDVVNSGLIYAYSGSQGSGASAISFPNGGGTVINTGQIIAEDADATTPYATAINFFGMNEVHVVNSGTIRGDYAINEHNNSNSPESATTRIENSGTITGRIYLGVGDDVLINSGTIDGLIELGSENDTYDGRGGHTVQAVEGGAGDDLILAGRGVETFYGDAGDDIFVAGQGVATFDGGAGYDLADYSLAASGVNISLEVAGAQSIGAQASTLLVSIEDLSGSAFDDTLTGNAQANLLLGWSGDDRLYGKDGDDYLIGEDGADRLDGGAGGDVLSGGRGADSLTGGASADVFRFIQGDGQDVIEDFVIGQDKIDLSDDDHGYSEILGLVQDGADVMVQLSSNDSIRVKNVQVEALRSSIVLLGITPQDDGW